VLRIYVAGPLSTGTYSETTANIRRAIDYADSIFLMGGAPFVPHLSHFWNLFHMHSWDEWMELDHEWIKVCDALFRMPGESRGADQEVAWMKALGKPVYYNMEEVRYALQQARLARLNGNNLGANSHPGTGNPGVPVPAV
jgi:hypothetical protein